MPRLSSFVGFGGSYSSARHLRGFLPSIQTRSISNFAAPIGTSSYTTQIVATGSPSITSYSATGLPTGMSIDTGTGVLSGAPNLAYTYFATISATNSVGTASVSLTINTSSNLSIATPRLNTNIVTVATGSPFSFQLTTLGEDAYIFYANTALPSGVSLDQSTGIVSGTIATPIVSSLSFSAENSGGIGGTSTILLVAQSINTGVAAPVISSTLSATGYTTFDFSYQMAATNSPTVYYAIGLPSNLSINNTTGVISGNLQASSGSQIPIKMCANNGGGASPVRVLLLSVQTYSGWALNSSSPTGTYNQVAMDSTGTQQAAVISTSIYVSSDSGATWASKLSGGSYTGVAIAGNGNIILALQSGPVRVSNNFGETWADVAGGLPQTSGFTAAAMSINGVVRMAVQNPGRVYRSIDSGVTWFQSLPPSSSWADVALSSTGSVQTVISNANLLYTSINSGASWTSRTISGMTLETFHSIAMSSTGANQTLLTDQYILTSSDSGATWTNRYTAPSGYNFSYGTVRMSSDGSKQYVAADQRIYKSTDSGITWTVDNAPVAGYGGLAISSNGTVGIAVSRLAVGNTGRAYKLFV
jgi:photosystem II stability/assembly factor-like uncharacterized protein